MAKYKKSDFINFNAIDKPPGMIIQYELFEADMTQDELSDVLGIHKDTVSKWINENRNIALPHLIEMCKIFKCDLNYLTGLQSSKRRTASSVRDCTGLSDQAVKVLMKLQKDQNTDALEVIDLFIRQCIKGSDGSNALVKYVTDYKEASKIIHEFNDLPDDQKVIVKPQGYSITYNENRQSAALHHSARIFENMIEKYFNKKTRKKQMK